ncbi:hypothetical protein DESPIG_02948 [Desulfovibrio piger ATCC 29098]|uniref:Uncharacterized protein n=1 Tax=Desulfovibrio piger ATCC 29098 TaxID=411464 RepID=B6WXW8_9BACT|nr:hypothetical protein DESPIG_02948 [Desulfovibrio piger ATCC 29098]
MTERQRRAARGNDATGPDREAARRSLMPQRKGQAEEAAQEERSPAPAEGPGRKTEACTPYGYGRSTGLTETTD